MALLTPEVRAVNLTAYIGGLPTEKAYTDGCAALATELVEDFIGSATVAAGKVERAILEVGADLYNRKLSRSGSDEFGGVDIASLQMPKDPMRLAYPILARDVPGIG